MEERKFAKEGDIRTNKEEYGVKNIFRYADLFNITEKEVLELLKDFQFFKVVYLIFFISMISLSLCIGSIYVLGYPNAYFLEALIVIATCTFSLYELNKRMNLKEIVVKLKSKISSK